MVGVHPALLACKLAMSVLLFATAASTDQGYQKGLLTVPKGGELEVERFVAQNIEPRHAVAIFVGGKGTKRHKLLAELAGDPGLHHLLGIAVQFAKGRSSLTMHLHRYAAKGYSGKWTYGAIYAWLQDAAYAPVNRMQYQFAPLKYLTSSPYGTVLVVKPISAQSDELVKALEPYADMYSNRLKFTFFTKAPGTQQLCDKYGIWTNDEVLLLEKPGEENTRAHSNVPGAPKYRLEGVTPSRIERFFHEYAAGTWPRFFKSARPEPILHYGTIRELTGWDFVSVVEDPATSVLVEFVSQNCSACDEFAGPFQELALKVQAESQKARSAIGSPTLARMDQSINEHPVLVKGTPWLRYWPRGHRKQPVDVELRSVSSILDFLEERAMEETEQLSDNDPTLGGSYGNGKRSSGIGRGSRDRCGPGMEHRCEVGSDPHAHGGRDRSPSLERGADRINEGSQRDSESDSVEGSVRLARPSPETARGYLPTDVDPGDDELEFFRDDYS